MGIMEKKMETTISSWGYMGIMEKKNGNYCSILGLCGYNVYIGIMERKMDTTVVYWGYMGIMEEKLETIIQYILGLIGDNGTANGNYYIVHIGVIWG